MADDFYLPPPSTPPVNDAPEDFHLPPTGAPLTVPKAPKQYGTKFLDNTSEDDPGYLWKNPTTGVAKAVTAIPGFAGEGRNLGHFLSSNVLSLLPGEKRTAAQIREDLNTNAKFEADRMASTHGPTSGGQRLVGRALQIANEAPSGEDIYHSYVAPIAGEYKPTTLPGRMGQAGFESVLGPGGKTKLPTMAAKEVPGLLTRASDKLRAGVTSAPAVNAGMGATAAGVGEVTESPGAGIGASFVVPTILGRVGRPRATAADTAADILHRDAHDPDAAINKLRALAKNDYKGEAGSRLDLPEATGDPVLAKVSKGHGVGSDEFGARVNDLRNEQSQNRGTVLGGMSRGESGAASATARQLRDEIHAKADTDTQLQQGIVDTLHPPEGTDKATSGKKVFDIATANNERARAAVSKLYASIDPENKIHVDGSSMSQRAQQILDEMANPRKFVWGAEPEKILNMAREMPPGMTFNDLVDFDKTVGQARWRATQAGDAHGADMLKKLQNHMDDIRDGAIDTHAEWEKGAVQRGDLKPDQTIEAALQRQRDEWLAKRDAAAATGTGTNEPGGQGSFSPARGEQPGTATGTVGSGEGVSGNTLDPAELAAAAERQRLAKEGHGDRKSMFEEGPVGDVLTNDRQLMGDVPRAVFAAGPAGGEKLRAWLNAGVDNPGMLDAVKEMAINELHDMTVKDGVVTPKALQAWKTKFGSALGEIDQRDPGFSSRFDGHAAEQQKLLDTVAQGVAAKADFAKSAAAKLLNFEHPHEVDAHVAGLMNSKAQGPQQLRALMDQFAGHPEAQEGIRNAAVQWLTKKAQSRELLADGKASAPGNYLEALENARPHMEAVFGVDGFKAAEQVAQEMARTKRMIDARITKGGSDTANNLINYLNEAPTPHNGHGLSTAEGIATWEMVSEGLRGAAHLDPIALSKAAAIFAGKIALHKWTEMRARAKGASTQATADAIRDALMDPEYGHALLEHGAERAAARAPRTWTEQLGRGATGAAQRGAIAAEEVDRQPHAAGGAIKIDHAAHAARLVRSVPQERKRIAAGTEPMLKMSDNVITKALAIANEGLNHG